MAYNCGNCLERSVRNFNLCLQQLETISWMQINEYECEKCFGWPKMDILEVLITLTYAYLAKIIAFAD